MSNAPLDPADLASILDELSDVVPEVSFAAEPEPVAEPEAKARADDPCAKPFALGHDSFRPTERLTGLERMGEKLARALKPALEPIARSRINVTAQAPETVSCGEWQDRQPAFTSLTSYRLRPLKGGMLIAIEPDFIARLVEIFYGGVPSPGRTPKTGDFTPSEELLLRRLLDKLSAIVAQHWCEVTPVEVMRTGQETNVNMLSFLRREEAVVVQRFAVVSDAGPADIQIVYPLGMLRPIEEKMATRVQPEEPASCGEWHVRLGQALEEVSLPVRSVLARPEISVAGLLALQPGDVIPINLAPRTPLLAGARQIAEGVIGEQDGRAALMIEKVGPQ